jgi:glycosyltransferase involved in cell wall biosynthesis
VHIQHEHGLFGHAVSYKAAARNYGTILRLIRATGRPVVTTFHTDPLCSSPAGRRLSLADAVRTLGRRTAWRKHVSRSFGPRPGRSAAIAHTPATRRSLVKRGIPAEVVRIIPHGCLPQRDLRLDSLSAKRRLGLPASSVLLTMFGFVGGYKGHDIAVRALARMPNRFHLAICGGAHPESQDRAFSSVIRLVKKLGLEHRVIITGWLPEESADLYAAATDICLAPYLDATLSASGAITWALASGRPIVASKIAAFQGICRESPCMLLTTPGMIDEIVWAAEKLAGDPALSRRLVAAARCYTEAHSWDETARQTQELYGAMLAGEMPAAAGLGRSHIVSRAEPVEAPLAMTFRWDDRRRAAG